MNCPIQSKECKKAECALWRHDRCGVMDAILTLDNITEHLEAISGALEDIRDRGFPAPMPSGWERYIKSSGPADRRSGLVTMRLVDWLGLYQQKISDFGR